MRLITVALLMLAATGCYSSHDDDSDSGPTDARVIGDADPDAPDGEGDRLPSCDRPIADWAQTEQRYEGEYLQTAARLRDGERTWIAAYSSDRALTLVAIDETQAVPALVSATPLLMRARPVAGAMDSVRVAIAYLDASDQTHVGVFDPSGAVLSDTIWMAVAPVPMLAIRGARVGLARHDAVPRVSVLDAAGGAAFMEASFPDAVEVSIGLGRGLFAAVVTDSSESRYWGIDESGVIDAGAIDARLLHMDWDGTSVVGWDYTSAQITVRVSGGRLIRRASIEGVPLVGSSLAMRGSEAWIALSHDRETIRFEEGEGGRHERRLDGRITEVMAHASRRHRGAFVLDEEARQLVWIGWSCDPDR